MKRVEGGRIQGGNIVLLRPLDLEDGTEVRVYVEPVGPDSDTERCPEEFGALGFFGMRKDDQADNGAWVRKERERWHQRSMPQG